MYSTVSHSSYSCPRYKNYCVNTSIKKNCQIPHQNLYLWNNQRIFLPGGTKTPISDVAFDNKRPFLKCEYNSSTYGLLRQIKAMVHNNICFLGAPVLFLNTLYKGHTVELFLNTLYKGHMLELFLNTLYNGHVVDVFWTQCIKSIRQKYFWTHCIKGTRWNCFLTHCIKGIWWKCFWTHCTKGIRRNCLWTHFFKRHAL